MKISPVRLVAIGLVAGSAMTLGYVASHAPAAKVIVTTRADAVMPPPTPSPTDAGAPAVFELAPTPCPVNANQVATCDTAAPTAAPVTGPAPKPAPAASAAAPTAAPTTQPLPCPVNTSNGTCVTPSPKP